jgi:Tfp pilus assembly protein PilF
LLFHLRATGAHAFSALRLLQAKPAPTPSNAEKQLAHELYLRGRFEWNQRTPESLNRALDDFTQAIVHDPADAQNFVGLADTYNLLREFSLMPPGDAFSRSIAASRKAVELDDSLAEAHRSLAFGEVWGNGDFDTGLKEFKRAIEINPRDPIAHLWFANAFQGPGWYPLCLREMNLAQELDPASPAILSDKGSLLFASGEREAGLETERQVARMEPQFLSPHRYLARMAWDLRDYPSYLRENEKVAELSHDSSLREITAAAQAGFQRSGERGLLEDLYAAQERFYAAGSLAGIQLAKTAMRLGRKDEALLWVRREDERHRPEFIYLREDPDLLPLLDDPVFRALRSRIHFPAPAEAMAAKRALEISESSVQVAAKLP